MADYRRSLQELKEEWSSCTKCELGQRRKEVEGEFVFGEGVGGRGIMFIGEGPGESEEAYGRPFIGSEGEVLRDAIEALGITNYYLTNVVACRSCDQGMGRDGQPMFRRSKLTGHQVPWIKDQSPTNPQMMACMPRLLEEIYLVDPYVIVTLGSEASKALLGSAFTSITKDRGSAKEAHIPGAWDVPVLTSTRQVWFRKVKGQYIMPTIKNTVLVWTMPTFRPSFVLKNHADKRQGSVVQRFKEDLKMAVNIYNRYVLDVHKVNLAEVEEVPADVVPGGD